MPIFKGPKSNGTIGCSAVPWPDGHVSSQAAKLLLLLLFYTPHESQKGIEFCHSAICSRAVSGTQSVETLTAGHAIKRLGLVKLSSSVKL